MDPLATDKERAVKLAKLNGLQLPDGVRRVRIENRGADACNVLVTRPEWDAVKAPKLSPGDVYCYDGFMVTDETFFPTKKETV